MSSFRPSARFDPGVQEDIRPHREALARRGVSITKRSNTDDSGHYDTTVHTFDDRRGIGWQVDDIAGHIIEWGSIKTQAQAPVRTAASEVGQFQPL